jgi:hypothetical protein
MITGVDVTFRCKECGGTGYVSSGHPNDPSSTDILCQAECDDGEVTHFDELTTLEEAMENYPDAIRFQVAAPSRKWGKVITTNG